MTIFRPLAASGGGEVQTAPRRARRAALGGASRLWVLPWRAAAQAVQRGSWRRPYRPVSRWKHPGPMHSVPGDSSPGLMAASSAAVP